MKKCNLCNSEKLLTSKGESQLLKDAYYVSCMDCGNVMILTNDTLIPTPTDDTKMTKAMIEDAAKAFSLNQGMLLQAASLTADNNMEPHMQPTTVKDAMQSYVNMHLHNAQEKCKCDECDCGNDVCETFGCCCENEEEYIDFDDFDESEENYEYLEVVPAEQVDKNLSLETASMLRTNGSNYLVILPSGEKHVYRNCSKEFILSIINSIGSHVQLFELNEVELKSEVKYNF